jgi:hypothetical protein
MAGIFVKLTVEKRVWTRVVAKLPIDLSTVCKYKVFLPTTKLQIQNKAT